MSEEKTSSAKTGIKERALQIASATADKADALYNKLPLDKINEKLKGKVDVKSRKFKTILGVVGCAVVVLALLLCFSTSGDSRLIINYEGIFSPEYCRFHEKLTKAGLYPYYRSFFDALKAVGKPQSMPDYQGMDAREVFSIDYVRQKFGEEAAQKFEEMLKAKAPGEWRKDESSWLETLHGCQRQHQIILDNVVKEANKELAKRDNPNTIVRVKMLKYDFGCTFHRVGDTYQDNWVGEFVVEDIQGREFDQVRFACNVSWERQKAKTRNVSDCGEAPLSFSLVWFGTDPHRDNWMALEL